MPLLPLPDYASARIRHPASTRLRSSLRIEVGRYLHASDSARVIRFGRIYPGGSRYVCVMARVERGGSAALYFFHHGIGDWRRYPPPGVGPSIAYWSSEITRVNRDNDAAPDARVIA
jgi:hypothetical protein